MPQARTLDIPAPGIYQDGVVLTNREFVALIAIMTLSGIGVGIGGSSMVADRNPCLLLNGEQRKAACEQQRDRADSWMRVRGLEGADAPSLPNSAGSGAQPNATVPASSTPTITVSTPAHARIRALQPAARPAALR